MDESEIIRVYNSYGSFRATSVKCGVSAATVKKVLLQAGIITSRLSAEIQQLLDAGLTQKEIAKRLGVTESCVGANIGYTRGTYLTDDKSDNAKRIAACRARKKARQIE